LKPGISLTFKRQLKELHKKYRHAEADLADAYADIIKDREHACNAVATPGYDSTVWKYRCESTDMKRGQSGGFRIMMLWKEEENTLYPFCIYTHADYPTQPPYKDLRKWLKKTLGFSVTGKPSAGPIPAQICKFCGISLSDDEKGAFGDRCAVHRASADL
jgi:mRNA-degrading endonuclease RelE of RelBE toxin-antitoxin system